VTPSRFVRRTLPNCLFIALLVVAFSNGLRTTWRLQWPDKEGAAGDLYRDMALAQTILDSGYGPDPTYLGERSWYNPLTPAIIAGVSAATGRPVHVVATQIGAYANLLAPVTFFLMCAVLFDPLTALYASAGFLFILPASPLTGSPATWFSATYSPWFLPFIFVQSLFYLSLIAFYRAIHDGRLRSFVAVGLLWGLTFLGHTAPALILGGIATSWLIATVWSTRGGGPSHGRVTIKGALQGYGVMIGLALVVSAPFLAIIVGHYGLRVKNTFPGSWSDPLLSQQILTLVRLHLTIPMAVVALGVWAAIARMSRTISRWLLLAWAAVAATFLIYGLFRLGLKQIGPTLPSIVPSYHFFFYVKAAAAVFLGLGLTTIGRMVASALRGRSQRDADRGTVFAISQVTAAAICGLLLIPRVDAFDGRADFATARQAALIDAESDETHVFEWLSEHHRPTDVALEGDRDGTFTCASSGTKAVCAGPGYSNPYVDREPRRLARDRMFEALDHDDSLAFRILAERYHVTRVITRGDRSDRYDVHTPKDLMIGFSSGRLRVFLVKPSEYH
jgi:hypothetical protein